MIPGLGRSLEEQMETHSSILAWKIPWTEEPGGLQSVELQRVRYDLVIKHAHIHTHAVIEYIKILLNIFHPVISTL